MKRIFPAVFLSLFLAIPVFSATSEAATVLPHAMLLWRADTLVTWSSNVQRLVAVGDVNGDGIPDIVCDQDNGLLYYPGNGNGTFGPYKLAGFYELALDKQKSTPTTPVYTPAGNFLAQYGALGDFDGDGDLDLAVATSDYGEKLYKVYTFQNDGSGYFTKASSQTLGPVSPNERLRMWIGDVNGDGNGDLILAAGSTSKSVIYVMYGQGKLSFRAPEKVLDETGEALCFCDVNHDSHPDLVFRTDSEVKVFLGTGKGAFVPGYGFSVPKAEKIYGVAVGDLNSDGLGDLALALGDTGLLTALQTSAGFTQTASYKLGTTYEIKCADFTGDGKLDILTRISGKGYVVLPGDGKGGFNKPEGGYISPPEADYLSWNGDLNGDGRDDLIFSAYGGEGLIPMMNGGTPHGETYLPMHGSELLAVGDIYKDGKQDLLTGGADGIDIYRNNGAGIFTHTELTSGDLDPSAGAIGARTIYILNSSGESNAVLMEFSRTGHQLGSYILGTDVMPRVLVGDFDGDGVEDAVVIAKRAIFVLWGGKGEVQTYRWKRGDLSVIAGGDFGGDGVDELSLISTAKYADMYVISFPGRRMRVEGKPFPLAAVPLAMASGDIDGDGISDQVTIGIVPEVTNEGGKVNVSIVGALVGMILSRDGERTCKISGFPNGESPWPFSGLAVEDVTGDGKADVIYSLTSGHGAYVLAGNGDGTFGKPQYAASGIGPMFVADIDGNGQVDLVGSTLGFSPEIVIRWNGGER